MDTTADDGIYTGFLPAHLIDGSGGSYFGIKVFQEDALN